jgi:hypothetical protein
MKTALVKKRERGLRGDTVCIVCPHCGRDHWIPDNITGACRTGKPFKIGPRR